jgi:hypothetical protein
LPVSAVGSLTICHWLVIEFRRHLTVVGVIGWGSSARLLGGVRAGVNMAAITAGLSAAGGPQWAGWSGADVARGQGAPSSLVGECQTPAVSLAAMIVWGGCSWLDNVERVDTPLGSSWPVARTGTKDVRRRFTTPTGTWLPVTAGEIELKRIAAIPVIRYRYRGSKIPSPWIMQPTLRQTPWRARCVERRTAGSARGPGKRAGSNPGTAPRAYSAIG